MSAPICIACGVEVAQDALLPTEALCKAATERAMELLRNSAGLDL